MQSKYCGITFREATVQSKRLREAFEDLYRRKYDYNKDYQPVVDGHTNFIFRNLHGKLMKSSSLNLVIKNIVDDYNLLGQASALLEEREPELLPKITCHHLRHTLCTRIIEQGCTISTVQYLMGHHYAGTTLKIYLTISQNKNKEEMERLEGKIKLK